MKNEEKERLRKLVIEIWCKGKCGLWDDCRKYCKIHNDPCHIVKDIEETIIEVNART